MSYLFRLTILVTLSVLPTAALEVWRIAQQRQQDRTEVLGRALGMAERAAAEQERILEGTRQLLTALSMLPVIRQRDEARCGTALRGLREKFSLYTVIGAADLTGRIWCSSSTPGTDIADRSWFRRAVQNGGFSVGGYVIGRVTGRRTLTLAMPVFDDDQRVIGVVNAGLDLDRLASDLTRRAPARGISLTLADPEGVVLVDLPDNRLVGQQIPERYRHVQSAVRPGVIDTEWLNNQRQIVGYVPVAASASESFLVAVGFDRQRFLEDAHPLGWPLAVSAGVLSAAMLAAWFFAARFIRTPINKLISVTERWRQGDMTARAGRIDRNSELTQLGSAFDAMADAVAERSRRLTDILESTTDSVWGIDREWRVIFQNRRAQARLVGYDLLGRNLWEVFPDLEKGPVGTAYHRVMSHRIPAQVTFYFEPLAVHFEANAFPAEAGGITLFVRDVTEEIRTRGALVHQAYHDPLTDLPNRIRLNEMTVEGKDGEVPSALVLFDLDGFKHVNDTLGHPAGDEILRDAASRLAVHMGRRGELARLGGDEFAALLFGIESGADEVVVSNMLTGLDQSPFAIRGRHFRLTASAGIARVPSGTVPNPEILLSNADLALYRAKAAGGGVYRIFNEADRVDYDAQRQLDEDLGRAIDQGEFEIHYQPQLKLAGGTLVGAEALLRWRHPARGLLPPSVFLSILERSRYCRRVGNWIIGEACRQNAIWRSAGLDLRMGVNLFSEQLRSVELVGIIDAELATHSLPPNSLELELTENIALRQEKDEIVAILEALKARGVGIAFDDFGTGFASLTTLRNFPVTRLKIDRSFVTGLPNSAHDTAIVESVLLVASRLGLGVVAEGVETDVQENFLRASGCEEGQGYRYGRPMKAEDFLAAWRATLPLA